MEITFMRTKDYKLLIWFLVALAIALIPWILLA